MRISAMSNGHFETAELAARMMGEAAARPVWLRNWPALCLPTIRWPVGADASSILDLDERDLIQAWSDGSHRSAVRRLVGWVPLISRTQREICTHAGIGCGLGFLTL